MRYLQFQISLVVAVIAFFAALYGGDIFQFPSPHMLPMYVVLPFSVVLFCVGYFVAVICIASRVSQIKTGAYLCEVKEYLFRMCEESKHSTRLEALRRELELGLENWASDKSPFFGFMKIMGFLLAVAGALIAYSLCRIAFFALRQTFILHLGWNLTHRVIPSLDLAWDNFLSVAVGMAGIIVLSKVLTSRFRKRMEEEESEFKKRSRLSEPS